MALIKGQMRTGNQQTAASNCPETRCVTSECLVHATQFLFNVEPFQPSVH